MFFTVINININIYWNLFQKPLLVIITSIFCSLKVTKKSDDFALEVLWISTLMFIKSIKSVRLCWKFRFSSFFSLQQLFLQIFLLTKEIFNFSRKRNILEFIYLFIIIQQKTLFFQVSRSGVVTTADCISYC